MRMLQPPPHACLLVVDAQHQFISPWTTHIFPGIQALIPTYPWVIASRLLPCEKSPIFRWKGWRSAAASDEASTLAIDLSVRPAATTLITEKTTFGGFTPAARDWLSAKGASEIHVCGMDTDMCIVRSVFEIMEAGYRPVVLSRLCATTAGEPLHSHALLQLKRLVGKNQMA